MSSRYGGRGYSRYGGSDDDRGDEGLYERDAERGYGSSPGGRYERGSDYSTSRRGGYSSMRGGNYGGGNYERDYGREREYDAGDYRSRPSARDYGTGEYGSRYGREPLERGGYMGPSGRYEGEESGRVRGLRAYGRDYERRGERPARRDDDAAAVRDYDTDYGRTTSRFYGRSGYEYGRDDYEDERAEHRRREERGREDERRGESWLDRAADQVRSWFGGDDERDDDEARQAGGRGEGKFRGQGPKNYQRSDERLREEVCDRLTDNEWLDASEVEVNVVAAEVILTGAVDSRYAKRLAENIAESVSGVSNVQNNLRVQSYQAAADRPVAGLDTPLPTTAAVMAPASDLAAPADAPDLNVGHSSSKAAGKN